MTFIKSYGTYFPQFTIADDLLHPKGRKNNHSIAYVDEDIITMAYQAVINSKLETTKTEIDAIIFATTTPIFKDRYHASYLADLLELPEGITALDMGTTNRAGTDALLLADTMICSGKHQNVLIVAADIKFPGIGFEAKTPFGHAAIMMLITKDDGIAEVSSARSYSAAIAEEFKYKNERVAYDPRFARTAGFKENMKMVLKELDPNNVNCLMINSAYVKLIMGALKKAGFELDRQVGGDALIPACGFTGSAHGLFRLVGAMENVNGVSTLVDYNNGSNVITIKTEKPITGSTSKQLSDKISIGSYQDYLTIRKQCNFEGKAYQSTEMFSSEMIQEREKEQLQYLKGYECQGCGTVYYMKSARCNKCKKSEFTEKQLAKTGVVYTLTGEHYFPASFPPTNMAVIDLDGGGRVTVQQTDDMYRGTDTQLAIGDKVELVLRKMMETDSKPNYFWKCKIIKNVE